MVGTRRRWSARGRAADDDARSPSSATALAASSRAPGSRREARRSATARPPRTARGRSCTSASPGSTTHSRDALYAPRPRGRESPVLSRRSRSAPRIARARLSHRPRLRHPRRPAAGVRRRGRRSATSTRTCLSFEHGVQKPDRRIFEIALDALGVEASPMRSWSATGRRTTAARSSAGIATWLLAARRERGPAPWARPRCSRSSPERRRSGRDGRAIRRGGARRRTPPAAPRRGRSASSSSCLPSGARAACACA